jgi:ubiquinone/menaquinone biosynthesis C-methylase UbiE
MMMKGRESGMPDEQEWDDFFDADRALSRMFDGMVDGDAVEFGCGYGTFTIPAAQRIRGVLSALDIEPEMVRLTADKATRFGLNNVRAEVRDFVSQGTGLPTASQAHAMIFNLLHIEDPIALLTEARRVVKPGGTVSVMHWRSDIETPRGPPREMRPSPEQCEPWLHSVGLTTTRSIDLADACPFHFAFVAS